MGGRNLKTVFINCSPKKRFSASSYLLALQRLFVRGEKITEKLQNRKDHERILNTLKDADAVVFCLPLYVDGVPSHVLRFLQEMECFSRDNDVHLILYTVSNNGFIEGRQSEPLLQIFQNFCQRAGLSWGGGVGIGGGVMLNLTRILLVAQLGLLLLNLFFNVFQGGNISLIITIKSYAVNVLVLLFLNFGVLYYILRMGISVNRKKSFGKKYTRILIPSFVFILFADIFFILISVLQGGIFRGWLAKKKA